MKDGWEESRCVVRDQVLVQMHTASSGEEMAMNDCLSCSSRCHLAARRTDVNLLEVAGQAE